LNGWTAGPGADAPPGRSREAYFFAGTSAVNTVEQTVDLLAAGFSAAELDSQDLIAVFGGRVRSAAETPRDRGTLTLTFLDAAGGEIRSVIVNASNTTEPWELAGQRVSIPAGARSLRYRFEATRAAGQTNDSYLDAAFVYVLPETAAPDLGAYGNTPADQTPAAHLVIRSPDLYMDWERDKPLSIRWDSFGNDADAPVRIDLYQDTADGPALLLTIAQTTEDDGQYTWIPASSGVDFGTHGLRIQISLVGNPTIFDRSSETFTVPEDTANFYVNDADLTGDEYTTAAGSNRNTGKLPSSPKPSPTQILRLYDVGPGQTVNVDTGDYGLLYPIVLSARSASATTKRSTSRVQAVRATPPRCGTPCPPPLRSSSLTTPTS
jgi:hypothetical protein